MQNLIAKFQKSLTAMIKKDFKIGKRNRKTEKIAYPAEATARPSKTKQNADNDGQEENEETETAERVKTENKKESA